MSNIHLMDCVYPDWVGGFTVSKHKMEDFEKDGFCRICGMDIEQASLGVIKLEDFLKKLK